MNRFVLILFSLFFLQGWLSSQHLLRGNLMAEDSPLPYAEVLLRDSLEQFVQGNFTDKDGYFEFELAAGNYRLEASFLGYTPLLKQVRISGDTDLGKLELTAAKAELSTVTVKAQRRLVEQRTDRLVFNVSQSVAARGGSALDALQLAPGVRLRNGLLELIGRGNPAVLLNGRLLQLNSAELTEFLTGLTADDIERIEVIANPPARYAAAGQGGLLNIVLKKGRGDAWKNATTLSHTQADYGHVNLSNTFFFNRERLSFSANASVRRGFQRDEETIAVTYPTSRWETELVNKSSRENLGGRVSMDYRISDRLSLGGQYLGSFGRPGFTGPAVTRITSPEGRLDSILRNEQIAVRSVNSHTANLHGSWQIDTNGRKISFDFDLFDYDNLLEQNSSIRTFLPDGTSPGLNLAQLNFSDQLIDNLSFKIDVIHPRKQLEFSYGLSFTRTKTFGDQQNFDIRSGDPVFDASLSNVFDYREDVQAAYLNASGKWGRHWQWQSGLRLENTRTEGYSRTLDQRTPNDYFKLFPTLYLSYRPSEDNHYTFSYGRRINRPVFRDLNPFRIYVTSNSYSEGNPFLQPSFTDRFEFSHSLRGRLRSNLFFNRTTSGFGTLFAAMAEEETQTVLRKNYYTDYYFGIGESYSLELGRWSSENQLYLFAGITTILPGFDADQQNGLQLNLNSSNTLLVGRGKLQLNAWYNAPNRSNIFRIGAIYGFSLGWQQPLGKSLDISLFLNDVFDTASLRSLVSVVNGVTTTYGQNYASRHARLSISYRIGNEKVKVQERGFGNDGIRNRSR